MRSQLWSRKQTPELQGVALGNVHDRATQWFGVVGDHCGVSGADAEKCGAAP